jgi:hypothetical protein
MQENAPVDDGILIEARAWVGTFQHHAGGSVC